MHNAGVVEQKVIEIRCSMHASFNILMEMFYSLVSLVFRCILACKYNALCVGSSPTPFYCSWSCGMHVCNNEEMAFNYTEVLVDSCCSRSRRILGRF